MKNYHTESLSVCIALRYHRKAEVAKIILEQTNHHIRTTISYGYSYPVSMSLVDVINDCIHWEEEDLFDE